MTDARPPFPRQCGWCYRYPTDQDRLRAEAGERVNHTMCPECVENWDRSLTDLPTRKETR